MGDDSLECLERTQFSSRDAPHGMTWYETANLTPSQQTNLNCLKFETIYQNQWYLENHPEIRGLIALMIKEILKAQPRTEIPQFLAKYFSKPKQELKQQLARFLRAKMYSKQTKYDRPKDKSTLSLPHARRISHKAINLRANPSVETIKSPSFTRLRVPEGATMELEVPTRRRITERRIIIQPIAVELGKDEER